MKASISPAAQAVLEAFNAGERDSDPMLVRPEQVGLAAAIRAAAGQVQHRWDGMECVDHLQAIAAELEAHHA